MKIIESFKPINLADIGEVSLLDRLDYKYIFHIDKVKHLLKALSENYYILEIDSYRIHPYKTLYFDTSDFKLFNMHQNGRKNRFKFRTRQYSASGHVFNEVKLKTNKGKTIKKRISRSQFQTEIDNKFSNLIIENTIQNPTDLIPAIYIYFDRITFCDFNKSERLTLDLKLNFEDTFSDKIKSFNNMVILEVKQDRLNRTSNINDILNKLRIFPMGSSKYCLGIYHIKDNIKKNNFKPKNRFINKVLSS